MELNEEIERFRALDANRTPGQLVPQHNCLIGKPGFNGEVAALRPDHFEMIVEQCVGFHSEADAEFFAAAPAMIAVINQQAELLKQAEEAMDYMQRDLILRAERNMSGEKIVACGMGCWVQFCRALDALKGPKA